MTINLGLILLLVFVTTVFIIMGASHWLFGTFSPLKRRLREIADPKVQHAQMGAREGAFTVHFSSRLQRSCYRLRTGASRV